jgi:lactoylglutathione lyase
MRITFIATVIPVLTSFIAWQALWSQTSNADQAAQIDHIALHVRDLAESTRFYQTVIGLEKVPDPFKDDRHVFLRLSARTELHLIAGAQGVIEHDIDVHFALRVASVDLFRAQLAQMKIKYFSSKKEEGVVTTRPDGVKQIYFQDPDGYWVEVNDSRL